MTKDRIKAIYKAPGKAPVFIEIENKLEALQRAIGGYLESVTIATDCCILCDEEGRLKGLPYNCKILNMELSGPILIVGVDGDELCDVMTDADFLIRP